MSNVKEERILIGTFSVMLYYIKLREGSFPALLLTHVGGAAAVTGDFLINIRHISEYSDPDASFLPELWSLLCNSEGPHKFGENI